MVLADHTNAAFSIHHLNF